MPAHDELPWYRFLADHPEIFSRIGSRAQDSLRIQKELRNEYPPEAVRLALTVVGLREKAEARGFPHADQLWLDRLRFEQATAWPVAKHKARRFEGAVVDCCCGGGMDALALAGRGEVTAVDSDPLACWMTEQNARALGVGEWVSVRCQAVEEVDAGERQLHLDPDRRGTGGRRAARIEDYIPSLEIMRRLTRHGPGGAIKLSPATNFGGKFDDVEIELVSLHGECKEATIWFGALGQSGQWRATVLPDGASLSGDPLSVEPALSPLETFLYDPDPALVRAGLIDLFCAEWGVGRLDLSEEYLTSQTLAASPFARAFRVLAELPNNETKLKRQLRQLGAGAIEIKTRHLPVRVEELRRRLPKAGTRPLVVLFCRIGGRSRIVIAERV